MYVHTSLSKRHFPVSGAEKMDQYPMNNIYSWPRFAEVRGTQKFVPMYSEALGWGSSSIFSLVIDGTGCLRTAYLSPADAFHGTPSLAWICIHAFMHARMHVCMQMWSKFCLFSQFISVSFCYSSSVILLLRVPRRTCVALSSCMLLLCEGLHRS